MRDADSFRMRMATEKQTLLIRRDVVKQVCTIILFYLQLLFLLNTFLTIDCYRACCACGSGQGCPRRQRDTHPGLSACSVQALTLQLENLEKKLQFTEKNNFVMRDFIATKEVGVLKCSDLFLDGSGLHNCLKAR
jgi:hypothetical protein